MADLSITWDHKRSRTTQNGDGSETTQAASVRVNGRTQLVVMKGHGENDTESVRAAQLAVCNIALDLSDTK